MGNKKIEFSKVQQDILSYIYEESNGEAIERSVQEIMQRVKHSRTKIQKAIDDLGGFWDIEYIPSNKEIDETNSICDTNISYGTPMVCNMSIIGGVTTWEENDILKRVWYTFHFDFNINEIISAHKKESKQWLVMKN